MKKMFKTILVLSMLSLASVSVASKPDLSKYQTSLNACYDAYKPALIMAGPGEKKVLQDQIKNSCHKQYKTALTMVEENRHPALMRDFRKIHVWMEDTFERQFSGRSISKRRQGTIMADLLKSLELGILSFEIWSNTGT